MNTDARDRDWDAEFEQIARHLEAERSTDEPRRGAHRDLFEHSPTTSSTTDAPVPAADPVPGFHAQWRIPDDTPRAPQPADVPSLDEDDTFVPPEPAPLETGDPALVIMLGCFVVGPLWLVYLTLFDRDAASLWWMLAAGILVGGFALAVARQPKNRDEDDDDDDGARV